MKPCKNYLMPNTKPGLILDKDYPKRYPDIVLLQLPFWGIDCAPLGLALLKSYLAQNNISCKVFDINVHAYCLRGKKYQDYWELKHGYNFCRDKEKMLQYYRDNRSLFLYYMNEIRKLNPKVVGCSCKSSSFLLAQFFLEDLRNNIGHFKHILGGPEVASFMNNADELLSRNYIDAINLGEGEISLLNYMRSLEEDAEEPIAGLSYKKSNHIIKGEPTNFIKNLDKLPFPDFSDYNLKHYLSPNRLTSYTSRGCINRCIYCSAVGYLKPFRFRTGQRMLDEIKYLKQQYPDLNYIRMCDDISNSNIKELEIFCDLMIKSKLGVKWNLENAVIRKEMRTSLYRKLKKAGCTLIGYGMETASTKLLVSVGKVLCKDVDMPAVLKEGKKAGIFISVNIMFGLPKETEEDFMQLLEFLKKNKNAISMINPSLNLCEFYPGSAGSQNPEKYGLDISKGHLFWETLDGKNTYLVRMRRFELFCKMAKRYRLTNYIKTEELADKHKLLFRYYFAIHQAGKALEEYDKIEPAELTKKLRQMHTAIKNKRFNIDTKEDIKPLRNILPYCTTFSKTFMITSLTHNLNSLEEQDIFKNAWVKPWQQKLRFLAHRLIGYDKYIDKKINNIYMMLKIIDEKIKCYLEDGKK